MPRCLIMSCSKTKNTGADKMSALYRYNGPPFKVVRRFLKDETQIDKDLDVFILSAYYGLISSVQLIGNYDQKMTKETAEELRPKVLSKLNELLKKNYAEIFVLLSKEYFAALNGWESIVPASTHVIRSQTSEGKRLRELKSWLYQRDVVKVEKPSKVTGHAVIKGVIIEASPLEIEQKALNALKANLGEPYNFRDWYCLIGDGSKVSSKWLVSLLSGIDVSQFQASDARRVLGQLGVTVFRKS